MAAAPAAGARRPDRSGIPLTVDALPCITAMVDSLVAPAFPEHPVGEGRHQPRVFHPGGSVHGAAFGAAAIGMRAFARRNHCSGVGMSIVRRRNQHVRVRVARGPSRRGPRMASVRQLLVVREDRAAPLDSACPFQTARWWIRSKSRVRIASPIRRHTTHRWCLRHWPDSSRSQSRDRCGRERFLRALAQLGGGEREGGRPAGDRATWKFRGLFFGHCRTARDRFDFAVDDKRPRTGSWIRSPVRQRLQWRDHASLLDKYSAEDRCIGSQIGACGSPSSSEAGCRWSWTRRRVSTRQVWPSPHTFDAPVSSRRFMRTNPPRETLGPVERVSSCGEL